MRIAPSFATATFSVSEMQNFATAIASAALSAFVSASYTQEISGAGDDCGLRVFRAFAFARFQGGGYERRADFDFFADFRRRRAAKDGETFERAFMPCAHIAFFRLRFFERRSSRLYVQHRAFLFYASVPRAVERENFCGKFFRLRFGEPRKRAYAAFFYYTLCFLAQRAVTRVYRT